MTRSMWAIILAGGDGTRLQPLTRFITGAPIPKQYCRITGARSLLEETLARVDGLVPRARTNLSSDFLAHVTSHLLVLRACGVGWSDWGTVGAIERTLLAIGQTPPWRAHAQAWVGC